MPFEQLTPEQQTQARAIFFNAGPGDGYFYLITDDGKVLSRNRNQVQEEPAGTTPKRATA